MALTIIVDKADNGNEFLCRSCSHAAQRSGRMNEESISCQNVKFHDNKRITFPVTRCDGYYPAVLSTKHSALKQLSERAYYMIQSRENRGKFTFISPEDAKDQYLDREIRITENDD